MHVVIIDDDADATLLIEMHATMMGIKTTALSSEAALNWIGWSGVDTAIVDYAMPGVSGTQVLAHLASRHPHVERVLHTARPEATIDREAVILAHRFLQKARGAIESIFYGTQPAQMAA